MHCATGVMSTQAKGCWLVIQIGTLAIYIGSKRNWSGAQLLIFTPRCKFGFQRGRYENNAF